MADKTFHCRLITPAAKMLDDEVVYASVPAWDGLFGVLPDRAPIVAKLGLGNLRLDYPSKGAGPGGSRSFLIDDGFVQMVGNRLTILAGTAVPVESITLSEAETELKQAESRQVPDAAPNRATELDKLARERRRARMKVELARAKKGI